MSHNRTIELRELVGETKPCTEGNHWACWSRDGEWAVCSCSCHQDGAAA